MAQSCTVIQADPNSLALALSALSQEILIVEKTSSSGKFLVLSETAPTGQSFVVITGDPDKLASDLNALILAGNSIDLIIPTFSASHYVVVYS